MGKSTVLESLVRFCDAVETLYTRDYLRRPTPRDLQRLLQKAESRGYPGMIGSIDCMHWQWKNCPTAWQGDYGNRKGQKSIIQEVVAGFDTWVWHAFFGVAGSQNDLNVLGQSPVFNDVLRGEALNITYEINNTIYQTGYYLADGIYPRWTTFVKTIPHPRSHKQKFFARYQEGYRKDVERCFGILQARWAIIRGATRLFDEKWKNCPTAWQGDYGNRKGQKSIILEAVAGFDTWVWHAFFGVAGSQNDLNVLGQSPVFNDVLRGEAPNITYEINNTIYQTGYYLADGIYPRWTTFVKTIPHPRSHKQNFFARYQEGYRKDVERCFGILQARWAIIRGALFCPGLRFGPRAISAFGPARFAGPHPRPGWPCAAGLHFWPQTPPQPE
ncbi:hypothetical protein L3X38_045174 [Prunus dulcis]|uniref:Protein ALP1-like n=1 Tax=Prunus dulcis TaxID=3755 RepID=A0AAD4YPN3_PRUDU|nr:hypothetical protein L3X38_045174 [Prunus dulcis]